MPSLGEAVIEDNPLPLWKSILLNGIGITGLIMQITIQRDSDSYYWQNTTWGVSDYIMPMTEVSPVNNPGLYTWDTDTSGFLGTWTRTGFNVKYYASGVINFTQSYFSVASYDDESDAQDLRRLLKITRNTLKNVKNK